MAELPKVDLESKDLVAERIEQIKALFPEIVTEGEGAVDFEKLRLILGDEIEEGDERYAFIWPGKADAIRQSQTPSRATLKPMPSQSVNWNDTKNLYIEGDNLETMKLLLRGYFGKVKVIFTDPPYNTGHDFVYKDTFGDSLEGYREQVGLTGQANADTSGRYHTNWLTMMYPRLRLARELLSDDGLIFICIDDNEHANLQKICDEVFGDANRIATIIWQHSIQPKGYLSGFSVHHNEILVYQKSENYELQALERKPEDNKAYSNPDNDPKGPWRSGDVRNALYRPNLIYDVITPSGKVIKPCPNGWRWSRETMAEKIASGEIIFSADETRIIRKIYLSSLEGRAPGTIWFGKDVGTTRSAMTEIKDLFGDSVFDTPKPTTLIEQALQLVGGNDYCVLDFFSGSSATAEAVMKANAKDGGTRQFIMIQLDEKTAENSRAQKNGYPTITSIGEERIRRAGKRILGKGTNGTQQLNFDANDPGVDVGFRVLRLDESCIELPDEGKLLIDRIKPGCTDLDIIFEMMLKWGLELTYPIEEDEIEGYPIYSIAYDELICCMQPGLTTDVLEAIAARKPRRVFLLDSVIDDSIKLNALQIFKRVEEHTQQKIDLRTV